MNELAQNPGVQTPSQGAQPGGPGAAAGPGQQPQPGAQPQTPQIPDDLKGVAVQDTQGKVLIPLTQALDERGKRQDLEKEIKELKNQVWLYQMNTPPPGAQQPQRQPGGQPPAPEPPKPMELTLPEVLGSIKDDEVITGGELRQILKGIQIPTQAVEKVMSPQEEEALQSVGDQMLFVMKPDAQHVLYGAFRQKLQNASYIEQQVIRNALQNAHPMARAFIAYRIGSGESTEQAVAGGQADAAKAGGGAQPPAAGGQPPAGGGQQQPPSDAQRIIENLGKPIPTSEIAGAGPLDAAARYANMTDEEIEEEIEKVKRGV